MLQDTDSKTRVFERLEAEMTERYLDALAFELRASNKEEQGHRGQGEPT